MDGNAFFGGWLMGILTMVILLVISSTGETTIRSKVKIEPTTELFIKDNKVDSLYIYKNK